jgi:glycerol kinase
MNLNDIDCSQIMDRINDTVDEMQDRVSSKIIAEQEYKTQLESCIFETRDILHKMQEDSEKESKTNFRRFLINTIIAVATLIVSVIAATVSVIQIL